MVTFSSKMSVERVDTIKEKDDRKPKGWGYRHQMSLILFLTLSTAYTMRSCMGVALVAMTHQENKPHTTEKFSVSKIVDTSTGVTVTLNSNTTIEAEKEFEMHGFLNALMLTPPYPQFKWSKKVQDIIISSFFWGYMTMQVPAGQLVHRFGAKYLITAAMFLNFAIAMILPLAAYYGGWVCIAVFRLIQGLSQAFVVPGIHTFLGKWATLEERGRMSSLTYGGQALGSMMGLPLTGFISSSAMGWPGIFRFYAVLSGSMAAVVWWLTANTPADHPKISDAERKFIENGLEQKEGYEKVKLSVPWSKILRHPGIYAIMISQIGSTWGQVILYLEVPSFMDQVMAVNIKANGLLTALPFMVMFLTNFFFSWFTDMLIVKKVMSVTNVRKLANSIGSIPPAIGLVILAYAPKNIYVVETMLVIICAFKISAHVGFQVNLIDISPNFAGTLMSMSNGMASVFASLAPIVCGLILTDVKSEYLWRQVFFMTAGVYFFTNLFYVIFASAEKADWNYPHGANDAKHQEQIPMMEIRKEN